MSNKDRVEQDWTTWFNQRFGSGITRRNIAIYVPIVTNFTITSKRYNNGTVDPPSAAKNHSHLHPSTEPLLNEDIPYTVTSREPFKGVDTNPNFRGDGYYFPEYQKHGVYYDYPEWQTNSRQPASKPRREIPMEIRRRLYF